MTVSSYTDKGQRKRTHLNCTTGVHVCQADFKVGQHPWTSLILLLSTASEKSSERIVMPSTLFSRLVLLQSFFPMSVVDLSGLKVSKISYLPYLELYLLLG